MRGNAALRSYFCKSLAMRIELLLTFSQRAAYGLPRNREIVIRKDHFLGIMSACHFPPSFYETMCEKTGHFAHFVEFSDEDTPEWICIILLPMPILKYANESSCHN